MRYIVYAIEYNGIVMHIGKTNDFKRRKREQEYVGTKNSIIPKGIDLRRVEIIELQMFNNLTKTLTYEETLKRKFALNNKPNWYNFRIAS